MTALLEVRDLKTWFDGDGGTYRAVNGVSFSLEADTRWASSASRGAASR